MSVLTTITNHCSGMLMLLLTGAVVAHSYHPHGLSHGENRLSSTLSPVAGYYSRDVMSDDRHDLQASACAPGATVSTATQRNQYVMMTTATGVGAVTIWGVANWDYFSRSPHMQSEGWFSNATASGGADKLGHFYSSYLASHALSSLYTYWGITHGDAAFYGAFSSFIIMGYMELGDSFSSYGFSSEDMMANTLGCFMGYLLYKSPAMGEKLDFRCEIGYRPTKNDLLTDYENTKYLMALKFDGFAATRHTFLKYMELHLGYYTRGFDNDLPNRSRRVTLGVGLNLAGLFRRSGYKRTATLFRYIQLPNTSTSYNHNLN